MQKTIIVGLLLALTFVPMTNAAGAGTCSAEAEATLLTQEVGSDTLYLTEGGLYTESNGQEGLQSSSGSCTFEDANGRTQTINWSADSSLI